MTNTVKTYYSLVEIKMRWPWYLSGGRGHEARAGRQGRGDGRLQADRHDQRARPQAAASRRQDDLQCVVLRREQGGQVLRRLHLSRRQDGRARRRLGTGDSVRAALREMIAERLAELA